MNVDKNMSKHYSLAKAEGRLYNFETNGVRCNWMITKKNWAKGHKLCAGHYSALKGVNVNSPYGKWRDEPVDMTGNMT